MAGARSRPDLGDILRVHGDRYLARHGATPTQERVLRALAECRTAALGGHLEACDGCGHRRAVYHSCRNRHCPKCQTMAQSDWLEARREDLLPIEYFHVVFTLPHELCALALYRPRVVYDLLFRAATETLATFARDPRYVKGESGGTLGTTAILHTWGQNLSLHPHLHCVVTGGMLSADGERFEMPRSKGFLFPVRALSKVYRGKFLDGLRQAFKAGKLGEDETAPSLCHRLRRIDWVVYAKAPFGGPEQVLAYLGRYTHRIAISNHRLLTADQDHVAFHYRDYADGADDRKRKVMQLETLEFIRRFSMHVLPKGFVRIRHYGLLANRHRRSKVARCRILLTAESPPQSTRKPAPESCSEKLLRRSGVDILLCPVCREGRMHTVDEIPRPPRRRLYPIRAPVRVAA